MIPFFSIVIPLYNKEKFVIGTIQSVLNQTFENYEIIVVEDASTDRSLDVISGINSEKIRIIKHDFNKGLSASRNTGIKNAKSNYIAFLDADDYWKSNFLAEIYSLINRFPEAKLFATNYEELFQHDTVLLPKNNAGNLAEQSIITDFFAISLAQPLYCPSSLCVEKSVFNTIGFYNENIRYGEDVDFNIRANSVYQLAYSTKPLIKYTMLSENQITQSLISNKIITDFDSFDKENISHTLKKFLDFHRYIMAKHYKSEKNEKEFQRMKNGIDRRNLNLKQRIILNSPLYLQDFLKRIKLYFLSKGIRFTTYD